MTCRDRLAGAAVRREGANAAFERVFVGGTRREDAAEGGGRSGVFLDGRGGGGMELKVGGFSRRGLLAGALEGEVTRLLDEAADEDRGAMDLAGDLESLAGKCFSSACTVPTDMDGGLLGRDCSCFGSFSGSVFSVSRGSRAPFSLRKLPYANSS